jgi:hypothetical protein
VLVYPSYGEIQRPFGLSALNDQIAAGAFMWVFGSMVFVLPIFAVIAQIFSSPAISSRKYTQLQLHIDTSAQSSRARREAV